MGITVYTPCSLALGVNEIRYVKNKTRCQAHHEYVLNSNANDNNKNDDIDVSADD